MKGSWQPTAEKGGAIEPPDFESARANFRGGFSVAYARTQRDFERLGEACAVYRLPSPILTMHVSHGEDSNQTGLPGSHGLPTTADNTSSPPLQPTSTELADLTDYERIAPNFMSTMAWEYISGGAADEISLRWNREAYQQIRLRPRVLVDVSKLDTRVTLFGREFRYPMLLAPTAYHKLIHPDGELATIAGANQTGASFIASSFGTVALEEVAARATQPIWFQLYVLNDRAFTADLVRRAEATGCHALVLTVDTPALGPRYRETRVNFTLPAGMERANLRGLAGAQGGQRPGENTIYSATHDASLSWKDVEWLRSQTKLPLLLKGILNPDDAVRAADLGVAGIIVSNHGGRNLDTVPATIEVLPEIIDRIAGRVPVLVDGGIRRGTDVMKALALGAKAVLIGRPYLHGLAIDGANGVARVMNLLRRELEMAMALSGRVSIHDIDRSLIDSSRERGQ